MRVAFQGEPGAYSEAAVFEFFANADVSAVPCESFEQVFQAVKNGDCQYGVLPIENSLAGSIHQNYDLLLQNPLWVVGEHYPAGQPLPDRQPRRQLSDIKTVMSHPQALAQCAGYLRSLPGIKVEPVYDTAGSVKIMRNQNDSSLAAIASKQAAHIFGMEILAEKIEDNQANFTRFLVVAPEPVHPVTTPRHPLCSHSKMNRGHFIRPCVNSPPAGLICAKSNPGRWWEPPGIIFSTLTSSVSTENEPVQASPGKPETICPHAARAGFIPIQKTCHQFCTNPLTSRFFRLQYLERAKMNSHISSRYYTYFYFYGARALRQPLV